MMYVVTFFSYKGGVGRTLALVNIAAMLAKSGRKVLAVDFDLEAPSLPSFEIFQGAHNASGLVDYVTSYRETGIAPRCEDFIVRSEVEGNPIWVMPAGRHSDGDYTEALNNIDWNELYEKQDGYLLFEDMKQQWAEYGGHGFDYVLIDSRTGHTDVGGICTRHLPDAVSVMFLPNDSNITGLVPIVENIRVENSMRSKQIHLHVTPSNVPDLDDEKGILAKLLDDASRKLRRGRGFPTTIHHYQSLDVLAKDTFSITRPNSKLSRELEELRMQIIGQNFADREGAVYTLRAVPEELDRARKRRDADRRERLHEQTRNILFLHSHDGEIGFLAAQAFEALGDQAEELEALSIAIEHGYDTDRARLIRGVKSLASSEDETASLEDLREVLKSETATPFELIPAIQVLKDFSSEWLENVKTALDRPNEQYNTLLSLVWHLMSWREATPLCAERLLRLAEFEGLPANERRRVLNHAVLCLIAAGEFHKAVQAIENSIQSDPGGNEVDELFNRAMAKWAVDLEPPIEMLTMFVEHSEMQSSKSNVNARQCLALAHMALGNPEAALEQIALAEEVLSPGEIAFSCWTYLNTPSEEMSEQLQEMRSMIEEGDVITPPFFTAAPKHLH
ncbi:tyrosine-protein kinase family protein [Marimonas arenosa]|uniref:AAA family ATPase n=1 Tax=Marimonas arenosa TaxID=1795305 RepID=A0AAE3WE58_9RHOB|nr:AAA family ATPase [Marimonas arenosa]MDQ2091062.1 AAA family ATPase [Marimonas arenosa]